MIVIVLAILLAALVLRAIDAAPGWSPGQRLVVLALVIVVLFLVAYGVPESRSVLSVR